MLHTGLGSFHVLGHWTLMGDLWGRYKYSSHCTDEDTEAHEVKLLSLVSLFLRLKEMLFIPPMVSVTKVLGIHERECPSLSCLDE